MLIIAKQWFRWFTWWHGIGAKVALPLLTAIVGAGLSIGARAAVIEFFNPDLNNYFITADPVEQDFVDTGAVGQWLRTGYAFATGGPNQVCRFGGNSAINPATGTFWGPNSHFYTADAAECEGLKAIYTPSGKSWKFESNDFLTTPAASGGCPAGLVPIYRAYNNGFARGIDSNHRITSSLAAYLQTVAAGSIGEGVVMCSPARPPGVVTAVGVANGSAASAIIGAAGGSVSSLDGKLALTIPAGALAANTSISVEPLTNLAPGKIGAAYRLTPDGQTFLQPVTLRFTYTDADLLGTAAEFLGAAFQTADGHWQWLGAATVDTAAKTVSVSSSHFTDITLVKGLQIRPPSTAVPVNGSVALQVRVCYSGATSSDDDELASPAQDCDATDQGIVSTLSVNEWSVNGRLGGGGVFGTVVGGGATATYTAPATVPIPNTVAVSARVHNPLKPPNSKTLVVSNITIVQDKWTGTASTTATSPLGNVVASAEVTWTIKTIINNVVTYSPSGTAHLVQPPCSLSPDSGAISALGSGLTIDYNVDPPTYHGNGAATWTAVYSCPSGTFTAAAVAGYFAGSKGLGGAEAAGEVSPDGSTIAGSDSNQNVSMTWRFLAD